MGSKGKVVIVGGGFGGIELAKELAGSDYEVVLIDKNNYHTFQPLLYQVATGGLEPDSIAYPLRRVLRGMKNVQFRLAEVLEVHPAESKINTSIGEIDYDHLVLATGSTNNFFNFAPVSQNLFPLKTVTEALDIRSYLMQRLERVLLTTDPVRRAELLNVVIIGGGPAGVEMAGALSEMRRHVLPRDFPEIDFEQMNIYLFEMGDRLLSGMSEQSSEATVRFLEELGIVVELGAAAERYENDTLYLADGRSYRSTMVLWSAGVKGATLSGLNEERFLTKGNRLKVDAYNRIEGLENVYAIGDVGFMKSEDNPNGHAQLAPVAIQQGEHLGKNLKRLAAGKPLKTFSYLDEGTMATVGRNRAVVDLPKFHFSGIFAWFVWMGVHLISLVGFRNKIATLIDWTYNYFNYDRPLGMIIRPAKQGGAGKIGSAEIQDQNLVGKRATKGN